MTKEEVKDIIDNLSRRFSANGTSLELVDFDGHSLKLKFNCPDKTEFKIQGKVVTMAEETKKSVEKQLKVKVGNINIIFI